MNTLSSLTTLTLLFLLGGCNPELDTETTDESIGNPLYTQEIEGKIERIINNLQVQTAIDGVYESKSLLDQMNYYNTPGVSIAVINEGKIEWARGFGKSDLSTNAEVNPRTLFEAGSVSKPIFALAVMHLKEKGIIDLDQDVNEYLNSWKVPRNGEWQAKISLRQLLSHTAGLTVHGFLGYLASDPIPSIPQILNGVYPANSPAVKVNILPGTTFRYSGGGTTVAQLAIEDKLGQPLPKIIDELLFKPLALKYSTYQQPLPAELEHMASTAYPYKNQPIRGRFHIYPELAAAGLWSNPSELATLLLEVQKSINGQSTLFKKTTVEEMLTPQKVAPDIGIGFFLASKGDSLRFGHEGWDEGFVTSAEAYKHLSLGAVIMANSNEGDPILEEINRAIALEYKWPDYFPSPPEFERTKKAGVEQFSGNYTLEGNDLQILLVEEKLHLRYQDPVSLSKTKGGKYINNQFNFSITFEKDELHLTQDRSTKKYKKKTASN